jgi:hypothetical protein
MKIKYLCPDDSFPPLQQVRPVISEDEQARKRRQPPAAVPSHCKPFLDAASYGVLVPFGYHAVLRVTGREGSLPDVKASFEPGRPAYPEHDIVAAFAQNYFSIATRYIVRTEPGVGLLTLPPPEGHPRKGEVVRGLLESWWFPKGLFVVFRAPAPGETMEFRRGDPLCVLVPAPCVDVEAEPMSQPEFMALLSEQKEYERYREEHPEIAWRSDMGFEFDSRYKIFSKAKNSKP